MLVCRSASTLTVKQPQQPRSAVGGALTERGSTPLDILAAYGRPPDFGTYYTPVTFHSDDRTERCQKKKKPNQQPAHAHEADPDCLVVHLCDETDGRTFCSRITRRICRVSISMFCCCTNVLCGSFLSDGPNPSLILDMTTTRTRAPASRLSVTADFARHLRMTAYLHHVRARGEGVVPLSY